MLALVRLTRASKPAARKCSPEGGKKKPETLYAAKHSLRRMMIPHSHQIWIKTSSISLPNGDKKKPPKWWMSLGLDSASLAGRRGEKNRPPLFSYAYRSRVEVSCKKLRAKNRETNRVDGRVWNCVLSGYPISSNWIVNGDDSVSCDSMLAIRKERKRIDPVRWWTSMMIDARMKEKGSRTGSFWFNSRNFEMSEGEFKIGGRGTA